MGIPCFVSELCTQLQLSNTFAYIVNQYKTCITMDMLSNLQQQRIMVDQLRREAAIKRINVSQAIQGEIFMQCSLNQNSHQEITKPQRFSTLIPPFSIMTFSYVLLSFDCCIGKNSIKWNK